MPLMSLHWSLCTPNHSAYLNFHCSDTDAFSTMLCKSWRHKSVVESRHAKQRKSKRKCIFLYVSIHPTLCQSRDVLLLQSPT